MVSSGASALVKTLLLPPLIALALYAFLTYLFMPWYRRYRERRTYALVPSNLIPEAISSRVDGGTATNAVARVVQSLSSAMLHASGVRRGSEGSMQGFGIGDEELEEGVMGPTVQGLREVPQGRLSRELEGGFMSDSSDES